jgi:hypothetical protein
MIPKIASYFSSGRAIGWWPRLKKQRSNRSRREDAPALIEMTARRDRQKRTKLVEHRSYRSRRANADPAIDVDPEFAKKFYEYNAAPAVSDMERRRPPK